MSKPPQFVIDLAIGGITIAASLWVLAWFASLAQQPSAMLVPSVLIIPLMALVYVVVGIGWIGVAVAERMQKTWVGKARIIAAVPLFLLVVMVGPMAADLVVDYLAGALRA